MTVTGSSNLGTDNKICQPLKAETVMLRDQCASLQEKLEEKSSRLKLAEVEITTQAGTIKELSSVAALNDSLKEQVASLQEQLSKYQRERVGVHELLRSLGVPGNSIDVINHTIHEQIRGHNLQSGHNGVANDGKFYHSLCFYLRGDQKSQHASRLQKDTSTK